MPISVTTIPETNGVMILRVYFNKRLINISTVEAAIQAPKITGRPPVNPAEMIGPMKEKLVPCMHSNPVPIPPIRLHCINVDTPEANNAMETKKLVVSISNFKAPAMISGGVMIATKMANKCCKAANKVSRKGGRSFNPYINSAFNSDLFDSSIGFFLCTFDLYVEKYPTLIIWAQRYEKNSKGSRSVSLSPDN